MQATETNFNIADEIITILAKNNCTVAQSNEILSYVSRKITESATVQLLESKKSAN